MFDPGIKRRCIDIYTVILNVNSLFYETNFETCVINALYEKIDSTELLFGMKVEYLIHKCV